MENTFETRTASSSGTNLLLVSGHLDRTHTYTELQMPDGRSVRLPTALLEEQLVSQASGSDQAGGELPIVGDAPTVIPLVEETLVVGKRTVETGTVRLIKTVQEYEEAIDEPLSILSFDVERVVLNTPLASQPAVRYEGDTAIYPLVEERMVLTKELILREELRVTRRRSERIDTQVVTLKRENVVVERIPADKDAGSTNR